MLRAFCADRHNPIHGRVLLGFIHGFVARAERPLSLRSRNAHRHSLSSAGCRRVERSNRWTKSAFAAAKQTLSRHTSAGARSIAQRWALHALLPRINKIFELVDASRRVPNLLYQTRLRKEGVSPRHSAASSSMKLRKRSIRTLRPRKDVENPRIHNREVAVISSEIATLKLGRSTHVLDRVNFVFTTVSGAAALRSIDGTSCLAQV